MSESLEKQIGEALLRFHRSEQGVAPGAIYVNVCDDSILVRCTSVFTKSELDLAATKEGKKLIQSARRDQRALSRRRAEAEIAKLTGRTVSRSFYDIDTRIGEQVEVYILE